MATTLISRIWSAGLDLLYPPQCALCRRGGTMLCDGCIAALPPAAGSRCPRCYRVAPRSRPCSVCLAHPPAFESVVAPFELEGGARELVHHLKYHGLSSLGGPMAALMAGLAAGVPADVVVPVPLHRGRER
ncbi:MAG TPA: double zinc ribbon domain-containing protein, partial [Dehalococcoidia bacterium]|nr:double zinc ribbon domain-containing protein [Dehalococcoidia bacterium]